MSLVNSYNVIDFYTLPPEIHVEMINGKYYEIPVPGTLHQDIISLFHALALSFLKKTEVDCKIYEGPVNVMVLQDDYNMLQPDFMMVCDHSIIGKAGIYGAPEFIVEVICDEGRREAVTEKISCYERAGVRQLVVVDTIYKKLLVHTYKKESLCKTEHELQGQVSIELFGEKFTINLEEIGQLIEEYEVLQD